MISSIAWCRVPFVTLCITKPRYAHTMLLGCIKLPCAFGRGQMESEDGLKGATLDGGVKKIRFPARSRGDRPFRCASITLVAEDQQVERGADDREQQDQNHQHGLRCSVAGRIRHVRQRDYVEDDRCDQKKNTHNIGSPYRRCRSRLRGIEIESSTIRIKVSFSQRA